MNYATFNNAANHNKVEVNGRYVDLGTWISLWVVCSLLASPFIAAAILVYLTW